MSRFVRLEVVTDTVKGIYAAVQGGADRIELVSALGLGGVTPSVGLMEIAAGCGVPVLAMIRPRAGDFTYSPDEIILMLRDIEMARECGLAGVVFGANHATGELDVDTLRALTKHATNLGLDSAIHRSFDLSPNPRKSIELCVALGIDTILTPGGPRYAADGVAGLALYAADGEGRIEIMAGSGVTADNVAPILEAGVPWVHSSCQTSTLTSVQPPEDRVAALSGLTRARSDTDAGEVMRLRAALTEPSSSRITAS